MNLEKRIRTIIENQLSMGTSSFLIYPYGVNGRFVKEILYDVYGIEEIFIYDSYISQYNKKISPISDLSLIEENQILLFTSDNEAILDELKLPIKRFIDSGKVINIFPKKVTEVANTKVGKYSYGPLCSSWLVEEVGAFSCFAGGTAAVANHSMGLLSTHPFLYMGKDEVHSFSYENYVDRAWYFPGVNPKGKPHKLKKVIIGNDVWLGQNVIITNGSKIGNGVIAAAGAIITKDVPDYAIVAGIPARIVGYRYTSEEIEQLNKISWWNWSDEKIRENYNDFYLPINSFIKKHIKNI